ncbi:hypothetical protein A2U01_0091945, partial [Trifolium medium]|nr:hypothetical protein [Trifolium medium]
MKQKANHERRRLRATAAAHRRLGTQEGRKVKWRLERSHTSSPQPVT